MGPGAKQQTKIIDIMQIAIGYDPPGKYISDYCRRTGFRPVLYMQKNSIIFRQGLFKMRHHDLNDVQLVGITHHVRYQARVRRQTLRKNTAVMQEYGGLRECSYSRRFPDQKAFFLQYL